MFFNLLTLSVPDVTSGCFSICWLWVYLMLLQDVFQSFEFKRTWRYSRMFFNLKDWKTSWSNVRYAQSQKIERHPGVTSGTVKVNRLKNPDVTPGCFSIFWIWACLTLLQDVFQSFDFERTRCYFRMFFNLLTLSVPDVTPGCFSIFWLSAYPMLLQNDRVHWKSKDWKTSWSNVGYAQIQKIEKHPGGTSGTLKVKRLKNILE
jgi:hypothetical protein